VAQPIQRGSTQQLIRERIAPFSKVQVAGDNGGGSRTPAFSDVPIIRGHAGTDTLVALRLANPAA